MTYEVFQAKQAAIQSQHRRAGAVRKFAANGRNSKNMFRVFRLAEFSVHDQLTNLFRLWPLTLGVL